MAGYRGIGVVFVRRAARKAGVDTMLTARLPSQVRDTYEHASMTAWVPIEHATVIFVTAAPFLFPSSSNAINDIGRALARDNLGGPYKHFVRMMSVLFLMKQTALLWRAYHDAGRPEVQMLDARTVELRVHDYRDMPERFRECMCGWIEEAITMTGGKEARVVEADHDAVPTWRLTWR